MLGYGAMVYSAHLGRVYFIAPLARERVYCTRETCNFTPMTKKEAKAEAVKDLAQAAGFLMLAWGKEGMAKVVISANNDTAVKAFCVLLDEEHGLLDRPLHDWLAGILQEHTHAKEKRHFDILQNMN